MYKEVEKYVQRLLVFVMATILASLCLNVMAEDYLEPETAFRFSAAMESPKTVAVTFVIADGYYMYRERFAFKAEGATLGVPAIPPGKIKFDDTFQKDVETYRGKLIIRVPVEADGNFRLIVSSQGCADKGLCYAPMDSEAQLSPSGGGLLAAVSGARAEVPAIATATLAPLAAESEMNRIERTLQSGQLLLIMPLFMLLGLGLSFTPCVLPMVPILSSIIVGEGSQAGRARGFVLALTYTAGMALIYTTLGITAGLLGEGLSASLQNPWVLSSFALLMVLLSLSMFGFYELQIPARLQTALSQTSSRQRAGKLPGVFVMGAISALIVGPCVAAPLAGALVYISQTRNVVVGGSALFAMAIGMSVPLLLIGLSAGTLLPRAGMWMEQVKRFFGVLMLGLALWMISPVIPDVAHMLGWAAIGLGYGWYLLRRYSSLRGKFIGVLFALVGATQLLGVATGGRDVFAPIGHLTGSQKQPVHFVRVKSPAALDEAIAQARGKTVMLDFYADWCVSCIEMEKLTFTDPRVRKQLAGVVLLQADVTANDADDKAMLKRFKLFGPPGIIFFDKRGREIQGGRVIGFQKADKFTETLDLVMAF